MTRDEALRIFTEQQTAYRQAFSSPGAQMVIDDLGRFCRARETCVVPGDRDRTYVLEGRREVWLRIRDYLDLTPEQLMATRTVVTDERSTV